MHIKITRNTDTPGKEPNAEAISSGLEGLLNLIKVIDHEEKERVAVEHENIAVMAGRGISYASDTKYNGILISAGDDCLVLKILD